MTAIKKFPHKEFAKRLEQACDGNRDVPQPNFGRYGWFREQLASHGITVSNESIRKWFWGETTPRPKVMHALAVILKVDEAWFSLGHASVVDAREKQVRDATADGLVNVIAGFIQMHGGRPAFPTEDDKRAQAEHIDIYAIIRGAQYAFHIVRGNEEKDGGTSFAVAAGTDNVVVLGVVLRGEFGIEVVELDSDGLNEQGSRKGGFTTIRLDKDFAAGEHKFKRIENFRERL